MLYFKKEILVRYCLLAGICATLLPMMLGYAIYKLAPSACYDGPCAMPLLLVILSPFMAPLLPILFAVNHRLERPFPDGFLPTIVFSGTASQIAISAYSYSTASPNTRRIFFSELLLVPQGFITGLVIGTVFWLALYAMVHTTAAR